LVRKACVVQSDFVPNGANFDCRAVCPAKSTLIGGEGGRTITNKITNEITDVGFQSDFIFPAGTIAAEQRIGVVVTRTAAEIAATNLQLTILCEPLVVVP
jgi:hypothetical protein